MHAIYVTCVQNQTISFVLHVTHAVCALHVAHAICHTYQLRYLFQQRLFISLQQSHMHADDELEILCHTNTLTWSSCTFQTY